MRISIVGSGYVGLVSGAGLSDVGHHVICMDIDEARVEGLRNGIVPIYEPGLEQLIRRNAESGPAGVYGFGGAARLSTQRCCSSRSARRRAKTVPPI